MSSYQFKHLKLKHFGNDCVILLAELSQPNYNSELSEVISLSDSLTIGFNAVQVRKNFWNVERSCRKDHFYV